MRDEKINAIRKDLENAYIDSTVMSSLAYAPEFVSNDSNYGKKVITSIENELLNCDEFYISVAFITKGGLEPLLMTLKLLEKRGIKGKILTTNYLMFTEPKALEILAGLKNIELKMYDINGNNAGFHTKGYIFREKDIYSVIIGSSNLTKNAITVNKEWNTKIVSTVNGRIVAEILREFNELWASEYSIKYKDFIDEYRTQYQENKIINAQKKAAAGGKLVSLKNYVLKPNKMQTAFTKNLVELRAQNKDKALLISATGTGKTYASAFAMRELGFKKVLFLVHRNQIAKQAMKSYQNVFNNTVSVGMMSGSLGRMDTDKDYIFSTIQTISKDENLNKFAPDYFDAIVYDEAHHTSADSYKKVMDYFNPVFSLGMTATPDKRDDNIEGRNIYEIFDYNIAYEIRLQQAMEEDMLCPFHYFGITDLSLISDDIKIKKLKDDDEESLKNFRYLTSDDRVNYVMEQASYYGFSGDRVKGLIFCSRVDEAKTLSEKFNSKGWRTVVLSGSDSEEFRQEMMERLVSDEEGVDKLDYILSVDVFSEGVDLPECNQVIMLRPTESPIVFIQQLGRGLRKTEDKEFVVILDFIGNYKNNFMIPIALSGDRTYNKDNVRRYLGEGNRIIPGSSTIHFDEISRKRIYAAIDSANFSDIKLIKENYTNLKNKLGRIPKLSEFDEFGEMDVLRIFDNPNLGSYYKFLVKYEKEYKVRLSKEQEQIVEFISKKLSSGKRVHELELINILLKKKSSYSSENIIADFEKELKEKYDIRITDKQINNIINVLTNEFPAGSGKNTYASCVFLEKQMALDEDAFIKRIEKYNKQLNIEFYGYDISDNFAKMLENDSFYEIVKELIEFGISRYKLNYADKYKNTDLVLYQKYTYEDVCRLLNWEHNEVPLNIGGYKFDKITKTFPVFINYDKDENISDTTKYEDHFTSNHSLIAISKSGRSIESEDVQNFIKAKERGIEVELFVRKNKDDKISKEFYYLGGMTATGNTLEFTMPNTDKMAVEIEWALDVPVRDDIYEYITQE